MGRRSEITIEEAAMLTHKDPQGIRYGLRNKRFDWGDAIPPKKGHWSYVIYPIKFYKTLGINEEKYDLEDRMVRIALKEKLLKQIMEEKIMEGMRI